MKQYTYICDGGSLKLGNDNFTANYPNNYGDGCFLVTICEENENPCNELDFRGSVRGEINIYEYDCGNDILTTVNGRYGVYAVRNSGDMILEKWKEW